MAHRTEPATYDPFSAGHCRVVARTVEARDDARGRVFPCEIWHPVRDAPPGGNEARPGRRGAAHHATGSPLILFSHFAGGNRRSSSFLAVHLASRGYVVAALDHSEVVAPELAGTAEETGRERAARVDAIMAARVPDMRFLLDFMLGEGAAARGLPGIALDGERVGLAGHSFGGWTVLATPEVEPRVQSVVAMGAGGSSRRMPGVLPLELTLAWGRDVPTLYLAAEDDVPIPLTGVIELFERTPGSKRMFVLRRADHQHFLDDVEGTHEAIRTTPLEGEAAWIPAAMRPMSELVSGAKAHLFTRALALAHFDATLRGIEGAVRFLAGDVVAALAARGIDASVYPGQ